MAEMIWNAAVSVYNFIMRKGELNGRDNMEHSGDGFSFYYEEYRYH